MIKKLFSYLNQQYHMIYDRVHSLCKSHSGKLIGMTLILLLLIIAYQQHQIAELQWRVDYMNDYSQKNSFARRIYDLEYVQDSHTSDLYKVRIATKDIHKELFMIKSLLNEAQWQIMQLDWKNSN